MSTRQVPIGVRIGAILYFGTTVWFLVLLIMSVVTRPRLEQLLNSLAPNGQHPLLQLGRALPLYFSVMTLVIALLGWGLWTVRNWARILTIVLLIVGTLSMIVGIASSSEGAASFGFVSWLLRIATVVFPLWYLNRASVRAAFRTHRG